MNKNKVIRSRPKKDFEGMAVLGGMLEHAKEHSGITALIEFLEEKDIDYWKLIKGVATSEKTDIKDVWIAIGCGKFISQDLQLFFNKCRDEYKKSKEN